MAPSSTRVKSDGGADTDKKAATDSGRHGSSRDYPVSDAINSRTLLLIVCSLRIDEEIEAETDADRVLLATAARDHLVEMAM